MKVFGIVGWKDSGKTGLMERLVAELVGRGLSVSTVKHAHHMFDVDQRGKDSWRHRRAGAREVMLASASRWVLMHELRDADEPPLDSLLGKMSPVDLVLVEGYKRGGHPKLECHRSSVRQPLLALSDQSVRAVASDSPEDCDARQPVFNLDDTTEIANFVLSETGLGP